MNPPAGNNMSLPQAVLTAATFLVYALSSVFSKLASGHAFLSADYVLSLSGVLLAMGLYAVLWQKVLSWLPLGRAYLCKSTTIVFLLCISRFVFGEPLTVNNVLGCLLIMVGLAVLVWKD